MEKFTFTPNGIKEAVDYLKSTRDEFYVEKTLWSILTKDNTIKPTMLQVYDNANEHYAKQIISRKQY